ncbi:glycosyltransferase family 4 protein [Mucilaginibacter sp. AW1-3]
MPSKNKILFISHDAYRTGAPIVLIHHLAALKKTYPEVDFDILLKYDGEMAKDFRAIAPTFVFPYPSITDKIRKKLFKYNYRKDKAKQVIGEQYGIIYGNTVVSADLLALAKQNNANVITVCHVHELDISIKQFFGKDNFLAAIPFIDHFIAASYAVKDILTGIYQIPGDKIHIHHEHIPVPKDPAKYLQDNQKFSTVINNKGLKICGSGTQDWRKGIDLFIQAAFNLNQSNPEADFHFYWIGGKAGSVEYEKAKYDMEKSGVGHRITLIDSTPDPLSYMMLCDLFLLSSREDPFPLVCLEAAALGKPIICFKGSGGMVEFVDDTNGWVINYLDFLQLNSVLKPLVEKPEALQIVKDKGLASKQKAAEYDIEKGVKKLKTYLDTLVK